jgi:ATP-dependent DNA ligase
MSLQLGFIEPQLLTSVDQPPQGDEWLHEIKHDGYRTLLVVEGKQARAYTRTGLLLARADRQGLAYAGTAFIALPGNERDELRIRLESIKTGRCPLARLRMPTAQRVKPQLVARVRHLAGAKHLRHGTVRGISR